MSKFPKKICSECKGEFVYLRLYKRKLLCWKCYKKQPGVVILGGPNIFDEPVKSRSNVSISLTEAQWDLMNERLKQIGITRTNYIRELILTDLEQWQDSHKS
jgi:hypothetical protein